MENTITMVAKSTGEVLGDVDLNKYDIVKRAKASDRAYKALLASGRLEDEEHFKEYNESLGGFIWAIYEYCSEVMKEKVILETDFAKLIFLATYINYNGYLVHDNGKLFDKKALVEKVGLSRNKFNEFIERLEKAEIIAWNEVGYKVNDNLFRKGKISKRAVRDKGYTRVYVNTVRHLYDVMPIRQHKALGIAYRLIPYLNYNFNAVCWNPMERDVKKVKPLKLNEVMELVGYNIRPTEFKAILDKLRDKHGFALIGIFTIGNNNMVVVNPRYCYKGSSRKELQGIENLFVLDKVNR